MVYIKIENENIYNIKSYPPSKRHTVFNLLDFLFCMYTLLSVAHGQTPPHCDDDDDNADDDVDDEVSIHFIFLSKCFNHFKISLIVNILQFL